MFSGDWEMTNTIKTQRRGLSKRLTSIVEVLEFADDVVLLSSSYDYL